MNLAEILDKIDAGNQNPSFTREGHKLPMVNEALSLVAGRFCISKLETTAILTIDPISLDYVSLPDDYDHDLFRIENITDDNAEVNIRTNRRTLQRLFPGTPRPGYVTDVAITEERIYFQPAPHADNTTQDLKIWYYAKPTQYEIGDVDEEPSWIPEDLHRGLIVDFALEKLWALEEDGIDGQKINTLFYQGRHDQALQHMARHVRFNPKQHPAIKRTARFF